MKLNFFWDLIEKSRTFGGKYSTVFQNIIRPVDSKIWAKTNFRVAKSLLIFLGHWVTNFQGFHEIVSAQWYKLLPTCPKEIGFCPKFEEKTSFVKLIVLFIDCRAQSKNLSVFFLNEFWPGLLKMHSKCPEIHFMEKSLKEKIVFLISLFFKFEYKVLGIFPKTSQQLFLNSILSVWNYSFSKTLIRKNARKKQFWNLLSENFGHFVEFSRPIRHNYTLPVE